MYYHRIISDKLMDLAAQFPAVLLTGARQTGKTTLLKHLFPDHAFISLDLPRDAEQAEHNSTAFLDRYAGPVVIDEVQYAPALLKHLKDRIDKDRTIKGCFILTGSQKFNLMQESSESLAGRVGIAELDTMSSAEVLLGNPVAFDPKNQSDLARAMTRGFFPELWADPGISSTEFFRSYVATYLERDVRSLLRVGSLRDFDRFLRLCAARSGQLLNKADLARDTGVSHSTVTEWLSVLEASNQIFLLEPYFINPGKRLVKAPKLYLHDTGLLCFLLDLDADILMRAPVTTGHVWETFVCNQIKRDLQFRTVRASLWFWRDRDGSEVDFVISSGGSLQPVEAKWSENPAPQDLSRLKKNCEKIGPTVKEPSIACPTPSDFKTAEGVSIINPAITRKWA